MRSLTEYACMLIIKEANNANVWIGPSEDGKSNFQTVAVYILTKYIDELTDERRAVLEALGATAQKKTETELKIDALNALCTTEQIAEVLKKDVYVNKDILEQLIKEQEEGRKYHQKLLEDCQQLTVEKECPLMAELKELLIKIATGSHKTLAETLRRFEAQKNALIKVDALLPEEAMLRLEGKKGLLAKDLSMIEKQIAEYENQLRAIEGQLEESRKTIGRI